MLAVCSGHLSKVVQERNIGELASIAHLLFGTEKEKTQYYNNHNDCEINSDL